MQWSDDSTKLSTWYAVFKQFQSFVVNAKLIYLSFCADHATDCRTLQRFGAPTKTSFRPNVFSVRTNLITTHGENELLAPNFRLLVSAEATDLLIRCKCNIIAMVFSFVRFQKISVGLSVWKQNTCRGRRGSQSYMLQRLLNIISSSRICI